MVKLKPIFWACFSSTLVFFKKLANNSSLRALAKQSRSDFHLKIALDCFTAFAKTTIFALFSKKAKLQFRSLLLLSLLSSAEATTLNSFVFNTQKGNIEIATNLTGPIVHKVFVLKAPNRLVIDFINTTTKLPLERANFQQTGIISRVRSGHPNPSTLRVVLELKQPVTVKSAILAQQHGLRFTIHPQAGVVMPAVMHHALNKPKNVAVAQRPIVASYAPSRRQRDVVVIIDPGHGGKDPGAMGRRHSTEKQVVLAIANKLKQLIDRQPGMHAVLTRNGDYYVGLRERMALARKYNADLFVAIHADAFGNPNSNGASVFALSQRGATSEAARWLAEKENYSELGGVNLSGLDDRNGVIRTVLIDLSQTATIGASLQIGNRVLHGLGNITSLHSHKVEQARFVVLKSPDIPSVLIETGFISNPREEMNLTNPVYQSRLSLAIFQGVKQYFWDYPPHGSRIEAMSSSNRPFMKTNTALSNVFHRRSLS